MVGFRAFAEQAAALGVRGWLVNRDDGTVDAALHGADGSSANDHAIEVETLARRTEVASATYPMGRTPFEFQLELKARREVSIASPERCGPVIPAA